MNLLPAELRFPKPPFRIELSFVDQPPPASLIEDYLENIRRWRARVLERRILCTEQALVTAGLTERARRVFATILTAGWYAPPNGHALAAYYDIKPFPDVVEVTKGGLTIYAVFDVLSWRAEVACFLEDIWDVVDAPDLDPLECDALKRLLQPVGAESLCIFCLTSFGADQQNVHQLRCLVAGRLQAKLQADAAAWSNRGAGNKRSENMSPDDITLQDLIRKVGRWLRRGMGQR